MADSPYIGCRVHPDTLVNFKEDMEADGFKTVSEYLRQIIKKVVGVDRYTPLRP